MKFPSVSPRILTVLLLAGCASPAPQTADSVAGAVQSDTNVASGVTTILGPHQEYWGEKNEGYFFLRAFKGAQGPASDPQLSVLNKGTEWMAFDGAAGPDGQALEFAPINRTSYIDSKINRVVAEEMFSATLPRALLEAGREKGLVVTFHGKKENLPIAIPAAYLQGFLRRAN